MQPCDNLVTTLYFETVARFATAVVGTSPPHTEEELPEILDNACQMDVTGAMLDSHDI